MQETRKDFNLSLVSRAFLHKTRQDFKSFASLFLLFLPRHCQAAIRDLNDNSFCSMNFMISLRGFKSPSSILSDGRHVKKILAALLQLQTLNIKLDAKRWKWKKTKFCSYLYFLLSRTTNNQTNQALLEGFRLFPTNVILNVIIFK